MFSNYIRSAWRNLTKNKVYSIINIAGLSAGLTCFILIALWVSDELSFDRFNSKYDRIARITAVEKTQTGIIESAVSSAPMAKALKDDYAEVEEAVRLDMRYDEIALRNNQQILQRDILLTDPSFFTVFDYKLTRGEISTALNEPYSLVLTSSAAKKYFGDEDPMGKTLMMFMFDSAGKGAGYTITGVIPDPPRNAHFKFEMIASFKTIEVNHPEVLTVDGWGDGSYYTYLLLKPGVDTKAFSGKISRFYKKYVGERFNAWKDIYSYQLMPLKDIYLRSKLQYEIGATGSITQVYIFSLIGIIILLLAGINYTNLSTARSAARAKEVGIKKVAGAGKQQLVLQYLSEAVLATLIALVLSVVFSYLLLPAFHQVTGKTVSLFEEPGLIIFLVGVTVILGLLSGAYPATVLARFRPALVLKGAFRNSEKGVVLRKSLVVSQFAITITLITAIVVIYSQMLFLQNADLGFNKNVLLYLRLNGNENVITGYESFRNELQSSPLIKGIATSNSSIIGGLGSGSSETVDVSGNPVQINTARLRIDENFLHVYGINLLAGKNFPVNASTDSVHQVILNEMAVRKLGWKDPESAIGKAFKTGGRTDIVVGVVKNFHFNSLQYAIEPLAIFPLDNRFSRITLNVDIGNTKAALAFIESTWKKHFPAALFDYHFVREQARMQYDAQERFSTIFLYFSVLSLIIACLGLYGLISYTIFQKTKEIGIRKVLGSDISGIVTLLSKEFVKLVILAAVISIPVAWLIVHQWLQGFAYRIGISWWMFTAAGSGVLLIALITVGVQSIKAAMVNPVKSLRTE